ncbi:uncharacterized protein LOC100679060 [Nasonia vitripennis]|uniref:ANK_REP_REGION domain-containing protein n=1 Tax=Nasonia vitripennis TaxID=7425 RepID=A0A7M7IRQ1_NASVI|nr:uncharacterized protein LOC100679060 [Nasonia vitripennis]XP_032456415.1 uncharacterized protein LOC100679060 [Nasonia vitripennis]
MYLSAWNERFIGMLLGYDVNLQARDSRDITALHLAVSKVRVKVIEMLLERGAEVNAVDRLSSEPLLEAASGRQAEEKRSSDEFEHEKIVEAKYPNLWPFYKSCIKKLERTKSTTLIERSTFFDVLTKCQCRIATIICNREIRSYDFRIYGDDIAKNLNRARSHYESMMVQEEELSWIFIYLPHTLMRKMARYLTICENCETKKIMRALEEPSRRQLNEVRYSGPYSSSHDWTVPIDVVKNSLPLPNGFRGMHATTDESLDLRRKSVWVDINQTGMDVAIDEKQIEPLDLSVDEFLRKNKRIKYC